MLVEIPMPGSVWTHEASGRPYTVMCIGREEETQELAVVYHERGEPGGTVWIRALSDFLAHTGEGRKPRFRPYDPDRDEAF